MYDVSELDRIYCVDTPGVADIKQTDNTVNQGIADGQLFVSSKFDQREIKAIFKFDSNDSSDVRLAYDALQRYFGSREPYWICFADFPQRMYFVKMTSVDQTSFRDWGFVLEVTFTDQIGLSRSIGTTGDQGNYLYGFGNNELTSKPQFSFSTNKFTLYNPSDVAIDPERRGHPFKITLDGSAGGDMTIKNTTNGTSITRKGKWSGKWVLDGVHSTLNDKGDTINTDYGYIGLQAGNNSFEITGFSGKVSFDFPVWWLS
ncbi:phage tail domain-containing protein [Limosilactobacillus equigenerosi]|nr:phage tail domain-containing protein [Limosilactobacillus equigenerosi]